MITFLVMRLGMCVEDSYLNVPRLGGLSIWTIRVVMDTKQPIHVALKKTLRLILSSEYPVCQSCCVCNAHCQVAQG